MDLDGGCPFCYKDYIYHIVMNCDPAFNVWSTNGNYCLIPIASNLPLMERMEFIWIHKKWYNKILKIHRKNYHNFMGHLES